MACSPALCPFHRALTTPKGISSFANLLRSPHITSGYGPRVAITATAIGISFPLPRRMAQHISIGIQASPRPDFHPACLNQPYTHQSPFQPDPTTTKGLSPTPEEPAITYLTHPPSSVPHQALHWFASSPGNILSTSERTRCTSKSIPVTKRVL